MPCVSVSFEEMVALSVLCPHVEMVAFTKRQFLSGSTVCRSKAMQLQHYRRRQKGGAREKRGHLKQVSKGVAVPGLDRLKRVEKLSSEPALGLC